MFKGRTKTGRGPVSAARRLFHSVSIQPREDCACPAIEALAGERFLSDEAPLLPVEGCDRPGDCRCTFVHYDDRRTNARRESDVGLPNRTVEQDQRTGFGRRITDG
jgi:hypothetical protein